MTWRTGTKLGRTLYRDEVLVGMVDTAEIAAEIVEAMNNYATLRENHTELQREYRELEEAVDAACDDFSNDRDLTGLRRLRDALKRLHARNK